MFIGICHRGTHCIVSLMNRVWVGGSVGKVFTEFESLAPMEKTEFSTCVCSPST